MIDLQALYKEVIKTAGEAANAMKPTTLLVNGSHFILDDDGDYSRVRLDPEDGGERTPPADVLDIASIIAWAQASDTPDGEVQLSRMGVSDAFCPRLADQWHDRDKASKRFFAEFLPSPTPYSYPGFRGWLDSLGDGLRDREKIEEALASASTFSTDEVKVRMTGAVIQVAAKGGQETSLALQRHITAVIPFGDPDFKTEVTFLLTASPAPGGGLKFDVETLAITGAYDAWLDWAHARLSEALPAGWIVIRTP